MEYTFDSALSTNIIYLYTLDDAAHKGCVKVGKASIAKPDPTSEEIKAAAEARINQQLGTAGLRAKTIYAEEAKRTDSDGVTHSFTDHDVHDVLLRSGKQKKHLGSSTEWFECSVETAKAAIRAVKEYRQSLNPDEERADYEPIVFRPEQTKAIEQTMKVFAREKDMLWNAKMRFGKTLTALQVVKDMAFRRTLIFTHRPVVVKGWHEDFKKIFYDAPEYAFGSKMGRGDDLDVLERNGKKYVFFASIQDLRGSAQVGGSFVKNVEIYNTKWDCIIIDEAHEGTLTDLGEKVFGELNKEDTKVLRLSGTPFNLLDKFNAANTYTWDYVMEQRAKKQWADERPDEPNPYGALPAMCIYTYDISRLLGNNEVEEDSAFNFREFFRTDGDFNKFVHEERVLSFLNLLINNDVESMYPFSNDRFENTFRHTLWMVPGVKAAKALSDLLRSHDTFRKYKIVNVAGDGDEEEDHDEALQKVENAIGKDPTKTRTITLSCGRLTTGVSVPAWTGVLMLCGSVNTAASAYMQTIFRVQTPCDLGGLQKETCYVFDFAPDRTLQVLADVAHVENIGRGTSDAERRALGDFLNFCPVISYENSQLREYNTDLLFQKMKRIFIERVVKSGFEDDHIYNQQMLRNLTADEAKMFEDLRTQIGSTKAMPKAKGVDLATSGMSDEEYEEAEQTEEDVNTGRKKTSELTDEEKKRLEELRKQRENARAAASILRGISIRMPLIVYGANIRDEHEELKIENFTSLVDDESWQEFMPQGVSKELFDQFRGYFDEDVFAGASLRIRQLTREADAMNIEERVDQIYSIFNYFRNPDKETVLTPPRVVNMHMGDSLGGWNFFRKTDETGEEYYDDEQTTEPIFIEKEGATRSVFAEESRVLELNSKSGLYPLYVAYSIYRSRAAKARRKLTLMEQRDLWDKTVMENVFVVCKTPMAEAITRRTLCGFRRVPCRAKYYPNLMTEIKQNQPQLIARIKRGKSFWGANSDENMKFSAVVGNPPYQIMDGGTDRGAVPVYQLFVELAKNLKPGYISMIMPARWYAGGRGLDTFRQDMISDRRLALLHDYELSKDIFPTVDIAGGLCIILWDAQHNGPCTVTNHNAIKDKVAKRFLNQFGTIIRSNAAVPILEKIVAKSEKFLNSLVLSINPFGFRTYFRGKETGEIKILTSKGWAKVDREEITKGTEFVDKYKILVGRFVPSNGEISVKPGEGYRVLTEPKIIGPGEINTETYIDTAVFGSLEESTFYKKYLHSKFARFLLRQGVTSVNVTRECFAFVPLQDFTSHSDIDWTKSVAEIDRQLYAKYGLSEEEVTFIETMIREM